MDRATASVQKHYQRYLLSIVALTVIIAMFEVGNGALNTAAYYEAHYSRADIKACVDPRMKNSDCQKYSRERTKTTVGVLADITEAYVICADELNGEDAIKRCVAERLNNASG